MFKKDRIVPCLYSNILPLELEIFGFLHPLCQTDAFQILSFALNDAFHCSFLTLKWD